MFNCYYSLFCSFILILLFWRIVSYGELLYSSQSFQLTETPHFGYLNSCRRFEVKSMQKIWSQVNAGWLDTHHAAFVLNSWSIRFQIKKRTIRLQLVQHGWLGSPQVLKLPGSIQKAEGQKKDWYTEIETVRGSENDKHIILVITSQPVNDPWCWCSYATYKTLSATNKIHFYPSLLPLAKPSISNKSEEWGEACAFWERSKNICQMI